MTVGLTEGGDEVLVTWMDFDPDDARSGRRLLDAGYRLRLAPKFGVRSPDAVARLACGAVAAIVSTDPFDRQVFESAPELRVIARVGVGTDSIDLVAATEAGCVVTVTRGVNSETAADHTLALMLGALRRVVEHDRGIRQGAWNRGKNHWPWDLHGATVGIVGFGEIGQAVARRLQAFGTKLLVCDPALSVAPNGFHLASLHELLEQSDVVTVHVPLTAATRNLIGQGEFALLRPGAIIVNTARGGIVNEGALVAALRTGGVRAAALDVFDDEPDIPESLLERPNVILTPHIGGISVNSVKAMTAQATASVLDVLAGRPDPAVVANPDVFERRASAATS
jgi:phosphoglycerate dehydrogenase-like enzyme